MTLTFNELQLCGPESHLYLPKQNFRRCVKTSVMHLHLSMSGNWDKIRLGLIKAILSKILWWRTLVTDEDDSQCVDPHQVKQRDYTSMSALHP